MNNTYPFPAFVILTKEPTEELSRIHDRMPLILPESKINEWINPETNREKIAMEAVNAIISYIFIFQLPDLLDPSLSITCFFVSEDISLWTVFSDFPILIAISAFEIPSLF
ncbi:MAG: SOS response-associated peptidase family protein [Lachnospiraceae bacterium]|nr:SOS response-associated peptidase family protein [Lachnospiraceae bacterium]